MKFIEFWLDSRNEPITCERQYTIVHGRRRIIFCLRQIVRCALNMLLLPKWTFHACGFFPSNVSNEINFTFVSHDHAHFSPMCSTSCKRIHILTSLLLHFESCVSLTNDFRLTLFVLSFVSFFVALISSFRVPPFFFGGYHRIYSVCVCACMLSANICESIRQK